MYLKYGTYTHGLQEAAVVINREPLRDSSQNVIGHTERWDIRGTLVVANHAAMKAAILALEAAYKEGGKDLVLLDVDGVSETAHKLVSANTDGGTRIAKPVSYPNGSGAQLSVYRDYELAIEADVKLPADDPNPIVEFNESLSFRGGGPRFIPITLLNGPVQFQQTAQVTPQFVTQSGTAIGYYDYITIPGPLYPQCEQRDKRVVSYKSPKMSGSGASRKFTNFETTWTYEFVSGGPLYGFPNRRP